MRPILQFGNCNFANQVEKYYRRSKNLDLLTNECSDLHFYPFISLKKTFLPSTTQQRCGWNLMPSNGTFTSWFYSTFLNLIKSLPILNNATKRTGLGSVKSMKVKPVVWSHSKCRSWKGMPWPNDSCSIVNCSQQIKELFVWSVRKEFVYMKLLKNKNLEKIKDPGL